MFPMPNEITYLPENFKQYELDIINSLISITQKNKANIVQNWDKVIQFAVKNPSYEFFDEFGNSINGNLDKLSLNENYVVDSLPKIYSQITRFSDVFLQQNPILPLYFYSYEPELFTIWENENISLGEVDSNGNLNTGSCVKLNFFEIDWRDFCKAYFEYNN